MRKITTLDNGLRIVSQYLKDRDSASIGVWVGGGGRYESDANKGVAHFLEHMAFKGSAKYSCQVIKQLVEGVGGNLNAFTSEEETCYYAKVPSLHLDKTFDVLADICFFPNITKKDLDKERTVILEEIKMYHDLPQYYVGELLEELLWPNHPLGKSLAGSPQTVQSLTPGDLKDFKGRFYTPNNTVIAACGHIDHKHLVAMVQKKLGKLTNNPRHNYLPAHKNQDKPRVNLYRKETEQMHLALGYLSYEANHKDYYALGMLSIILGGNMSSRLFNEVREKRGLAYSVSSGMKSLDDTGCFVVRAGVDNAKIVPAVEVILKVLKGMAAKPVPGDEFNRAKEYFLGQFQLGLEDTMDHMIWLGGEVLTSKKPKTVQDVITRIKAVTIADVQRVAQEILNPKRLNLALIGPYTAQQEQQLQKLVK